MKIQLISLTTLLIFSLNFIQISAHFFPNISSIPRPLIPNKTQWNDFTNFTNCSKGVKAPGLHTLKKYFQYFGYLNNTANLSSDEYDDAFESAVKLYQLNFNLNTTGQLDPPTLRHVITPRCGNPDIVNGSSTMHSGSPPLYSSNSTIGTVAHYSFFPDRPRWPRSRSDLTYAFNPDNQVTDAVRRVFTSAFERWSEVTTLTFTETTSFNTADIRFGFFSGDHGDGEPFDGVMGTLAHAFAPTVGRCHFDGDETWVLDGDFLNAPSFSTAVDLESVAVHEIGHLLGLGHSSVEEAIMYPSISSGLRKVELARDDILGVQELYGSNPNFNGSEGPVLTPRGANDRGGGVRHEMGFVVALLNLLLLVLFV